jgi:tRNA-splicing ligase RtcB (3'-phosphate/5'-hydroxy nucleic acid ligase)
MKDLIQKSTSKPGIAYLNSGSNGKPITIIGNEHILSTLEEGCLQQAINSRNAPGVNQLVITPDSHQGYGCPVGSVLVSDTMVYPGPVGPDIKCSMSLLQSDVPADEIKSKKVRRELINAIQERIPTGNTKRVTDRGFCKKASFNEIVRAVICYGVGSSLETLNFFRIPEDWVGRLEDKSFGSPDELWQRYEELIELGIFSENYDNFNQIGSIGGGNHFIEGSITELIAGEEQVSQGFGLRNGCVSFLSHFGSRGFGYKLANNQFKSLEHKFKAWGISLPGGDKELVYAPIESIEGQNYLRDMSLGANFGTLNHLVVNVLLKEALAEVFPGSKSELVYHISHNIIREEVIDGKKSLVHRKGSTRAYPANHFSLRDTNYYTTGHPILLPGNSINGSYVMVANEGAVDSCFSINHGAGRQMGRKAAERTFTQTAVDAEMDQADIVSNCRNYPVDEYMGVYKDFEQVTQSVELANLARRVARLIPKISIKDADTSLKGVA